MKRIVATALVLAVSSTLGPALAAERTYPRVGWQWPYATGPTYGEIEGDEPGILRSDVGSFDLRLGTPAFPEPLRVKQTRYYVLAGDLEPLRGRIGVVRELGGTNYLVRLDAPLEADPAIVALEPYHPAFKLSPLIGRVPLPDPVKAASSVYTLDVRLQPGEDPSAVAAQVRNLGGSVLARFPDRLRIELSRDHLTDLARIDAVYRVEEVLPIVPFGEETTTVMQTGAYHGGAKPYHDAHVNGGGLRGTCSVSTQIGCQGAVDCPGAETCVGAGSPQVLMTIDDGIQLDAGDLSDTRTSAGTPGPAHRKVRVYETANQFGGQGDDKGCDASLSGGFTHGQAVAAVALGNATVVPLDYGPGWQKADRRGIVWQLDGVAPRAVLVAYDAYVTPLNGRCLEAESFLSVGSLYTGEGTVGSLETAHHAHGARTFDLSWGTASNPSYGTNASAIDGFLANPAHADALLFLAAGNTGQDADFDGIPDPGSISEPATAKDAVVVGASGNTSEPFNGSDEQDRFPSTSVGPATPASQRTAPLLMAPGTDFDGNTGFDSEVLCRSHDDDQAAAVECDLYAGLSGTSYAAAAAAGAAMLVRDYFAQGFYPDGTSSNPANASDVVTSLSGAAVKSILVASADWMDDSTPQAPTNAPGDNLTRRHRFNHEQGYGRIQLDNALPLQSHGASPPGLVLADGGIAGGRLDIPGLTGDLDTGAAETDTGSFMVCNDERELRVALAWMDTPGNVLNRNLDLELRAPSGKIYYGNYFTDDNNRNGLIDAAEDCPASAVTGAGPLDESPWSLPACANAVRDNRNPTEAIFLSPDARLDGTAANADKQTELGTWTILVRTGSPSAAATQPYAVAVAGGVCLGSSVRLDRASYDCDDGLRIVVAETDEGVDPASGLDDAVVASRVSVEVLDGGVTVDVEDAAFTHSGLHFVSAVLPVSGAALASAHDGLLEVKDGQTIRVLYHDESSGAADPNKLRTALAAAGCRAEIVVGGVVFSQFGLDTAQLVEGGCERDARGLFTFGYPDRYMDSGERVTYRTAFQSTSVSDLANVEVSLRCVLPDANDLQDPDRLDNPSCGSLLTVLDSPKAIGDLPAGQIATPAFSVEVGTIAGAPEVEMVLGVVSSASGRPVQAVLVSRVTLNADELSYYYSTDFLTGGTEVRDWPSAYAGSAPSNEVVNDPTSNLGDPLQDYRFDTIVWSSLQATGRNGSLSGPWDFDTTNNDFRVGLNNTTTPNLTETIANWGEDQNFNGILDYHCSASPTTVCPGRCDGPVPCTRRVCGRCQFDTTVICTDPVDCIPFGGGACNSAVGTLGTCVSDEDRDGPGGSRNGLLDDNWSTAGGCGWQTNGTTNNPSQPGGVWHTGRIDAPTFPAGQCLVNGANPGACQSYEILTGTAALKREWEMLLTPSLEKVNQCRTDAGPLPAACGGALDDGERKVFTVEIVNWAWNMALDLRDHWAQIRYELDTDEDSITAADLYNDAIVLGALGGNQGPVSNGNGPLTDGFQVFAPFSFSGHSSQNGTLGKNRVGRNPCWFEVSPQIPPFHLADPPDDDVDNDSDGQIDELVAPNGPIRNYDITSANGPDMRITGLEDIYGPSGERFRAALGFRVSEGDLNFGAAQEGFGVAVDDMVVQWREFKLVEDGTGCATSGACATLEVDSSRVYEGDGVLEVTVHDSSPYRCTDGPSCTPEGKNDCNHDGSFAGAMDDADCDDDGILDVLVKAVSALEPAGEWIVLDRVAGTSAYRGTLPVATVGAVGVLLVSDQGGIADDVTLRYEDKWDGTPSGNPCGNNVNPALRGVVQTGVNLLLELGSVTVRSFRLDDRNGDLDGYPDTGETVDLYVTISNKTGRDLTNLVAGLSTGDSKIDCILRSESSLGFLANGGVAELPVPLAFRVRAQADRAGTAPPVACISGHCTNGAGSCATASQCTRTVDDDYSAKLTVTLSSDQFDINATPQELALDLDLNSILTAGPTSTYVEGFENGFLNMQFMNLDFNRASNLLSNGYRCQYNDPDLIATGSYGNTDCYLGFASGQSPVNDWHVHSTVAPDGGRAYAGNSSLHYGVHTPGNPLFDTYKLSQLDAIRNRNAIGLAGRICRDDVSADKRACNSAADCVAVGGGPCVSASPELSFKHQISTTDSRGTNTPEGQAADRAVVAVQRLGSTIWEKISPYQNLYDVQGTDAFSNCTFDPVDDGNDEDDYFDPTDPSHRYGPSSTCFPEFTFSYLGDTDAPFDASQIGRASDGPGLRGNLGQGTWVESRFDLSRYRGRNVFFRFLFTSIRVSEYKTLEEVFMWNPVSYDDGWYVDDVRLSGTLAASSTTVTADAADNSGLPGCGTACGSLGVSLAASPPSSPVPGSVVRLTASATVDRCVNGALLYQFWRDGDVLLRDYAVSPTFDDAPLRGTSYLVRARCSSATGPPCDGATAETSVVVSCPGGAFANAFDAAAWWAHLIFTDATTLAVPATPGFVRRLDLARGALGALRTSGVFGGETCLATESYATTFGDASNPAAGEGYYYLIRNADAACNDNFSWSTYHPREVDDALPGRRRDRQVSACGP